MANASTYQPFGFSKPVRITPTSSRLTENALPPKHESSRSAKDSSPRRSSRLINVPDDSRWPLSTPFSSQSQGQTPSSSTQFPGEEDCEAMAPNCRSRTPRNNRRLPHLQTTHTTLIPSVTSPINSNTSSVISQRTPLTEKQLKQQLRDVQAALSRTEADRERIMRQAAAGKTDQSRIERELETLKRENKRLRSHLEELINSPVSAKGDDVWGSSMYMDAECAETDRYYENYMTGVDDDHRF